MCSGFVAGVGVCVETVCIFALGWTVFELSHGLYVCASSGHLGRSVAGVCLSATLRCCVCQGREGGQAHLIFFFFGS